MKVFIMDVEETTSRTVVARAEDLQQAIAKVRAGKDFAVLREHPVTQLKVIRHEQRES
ncbi:MAG: hypothetical protein GX766_06435 [Firmicutes bacterium]|nr:hypothetical protein [Bacillota bacterium]HQD40089.1 hypothetical protein [Bacillota bacterium]